jgi:pre-mRNA-splicing factor RBM22/SLT11
MSSIKRDVVKKQWEQTDFPLVCETCLGDNPYIRMTSEPHGKKCKICETPFTVFAWQAGTKGRWKRVEICKNCAQAKNVCQVCIYDLQYGLPVAMRDKILKEEGATTGMQLAIPQSDANRSWFNNQQQRMLDNGELDDGGNSRAHAALQAVARMEPRYERNLAKLCSFYAKGECNRGSSCPFRHEMPRDRNDPLSKQNTKDRFYGTNDPVAKKMIWRRHQMEENKRKEEVLREEENGDERAVSTCYVRFDSRNEATNHVSITEQDLRDHFYAHGEIVSVRMHQDKGAFIEYTTGEAADLAIVSMNNALINGRKIMVDWARQPKRGNPSSAEATMMTISGPTIEGSDVTRRTIVPPPSATESSTSISSSSSSGVKTCLPVGFAPSAAVTAAAKARATINSGLAKTGLVAIPRPGGGVIKRLGVGSSTVPKMDAVPKPYYPSADPNRLGSHTK